MNERIQNGMQRCGQFVRSWLTERGEEFVRCRQCSNEVRFLEDICPHCGASSPAWVSPSLAVVTVVVVGFALLASWFLF